MWVVIDTLFDNLSSLRGSSIDTDMADEYYDANITGSTIKNTPTRQREMMSSFNDISPITPGSNTPVSGLSESNDDSPYTTDSLNDLFNTSVHASDYDTDNNTLSLMSNSSLDNTSNTSNTLNNTTGTSSDNSDTTTTPIKTGGYKSRKYRTTTKKRRRQKKKSSQKKKRSSQKKKKQLRKRTKKYNKK